MHVFKGNTFGGFSLHRQKKKERKGRKMIRVPIQLLTVVEGGLVVPYGYVSTSEQNGASVVYDSQLYGSCSNFHEVPTSAVRSRVNTYK